MKKENCPDPRGNEICTNRRDTYHEWNVKYSGGCPFCREGLKEYEDKCKCKRCSKCGKLI